MANEAQQSYTPTRLKRWSLPPSYAGAQWAGFYSAGFGESRESKALERSNFRVAFKALDALNTDCPDCKGEGVKSEPFGYGWRNKDCPTCKGNSRTVIRVEENHWAVGWVAWIAIHESNAAALACADEMRERCDDYPILSDDDSSELETEEAAEYWTQMDRRTRLEVCESAHASPINALRSYANVDDRVDEYLRNQV